MTNNFFIKYILLLLVQLLICNFFHLSAYLVVSILPALIFSLPNRYSTITALFIAFVSALFVDSLAEGLMAINIIALLPVAFLRRSIYFFLYGEEARNRDNRVTLVKYGRLRTSLGILISQMIFMSIYVYIDSGFITSFSFNFLKFIASTLVSSLISLLVVEILFESDSH